MMETEAWKSLCAVERAMYVDIASRYAGLGSNNGRIHYSVREAAERLHISKSTAARALATLAERGFIVAEKRGAFSLKARHSTEWRLTEFASDISSDFATKDFVHWRPESKTRYPERDCTISLAGPVGPSSGTV
jgi:DNA-binding transcriptional MocR family regulator